MNECDIKREVSINLEPLLVKTMAIADHVVFISKTQDTKIRNKRKTCFVC